MEGPWREAMEKVYGKIPGLLESNCSFLLFGQADASEVQRRALQTWGSMPPVRGRVRIKGERGSVEAATWSREVVEGQSLFFNPWYTAETGVTGRSTVAVEKAAVAWAKAGLCTWGDLVRAGDGVLPGATRLGELVPHHITWMEELRRALPSPWKRVLQGHEHVCSEEAEVCIVSPEGDTCREGGEAVVSSLKVGEIYRRLVKQAWEVPKEFRGPTDDRPAGRGYLEAGRAGVDVEKLMAATFASTRHAAVPRHMSDRAYMVATGTDYSMWGLSMGRR